MIDEVDVHLRDTSVVGVKRAYLRGDGRVTLRDPEPCFRRQSLDRCEMCAHDVVAALDARRFVNAKVCGPRIVRSD